MSLARSIAGVHAISAIQASLVAENGRHGFVPSGVVLPFAGSAAPSGWLLCDGAAVSRTAEAALFAVIGTAFGEGDGSTTFNLPDMRGRTFAGKDDMGSVAAGRLSVSLTGTKASTSNGIITGLSSTAGLAVGMSAFGTGIGVGAVIASIDSASQVTLSVNSTGTGSGTIRFGVVDGITLGATGGSHVHTLTTPQIPAHAHASPNSSNRNTSTGGADNVAMNTTGSGYNTGSAGGGQAHANLQPTMVLNAIIKS